MSACATSGAEQSRMSMNRTTATGFQRDGTRGVILSVRRRGSESPTLLNHRAGRIRRAGGVVMDLARLVGVEPALPGGADLIGHARDGVRADRAVHLLTRRIGGGVATLAAAGQVVVDGPLAAGLRRTSQHGQVCCEAQLRMAAGIDHFRFIDGSDAGDGRSLVRRDGGLRELRYGECRNDQNNGYDDQQFDKGKSPVSVPFTHNWQPFSAALVGSTALCRPNTGLVPEETTTGARASAFSASPTQRLTWSLEGRFGFLLRRLFGFALWCVLISHAHSIA